MKFQIFYVFMFVVFCFCVNGKRIRLRPLSAREVYRALHDAGREDAVPEGRVVTQGIAAIKGFALGVTKGIGGALLLDAATSNATIQYLNNLNFTLPTVNISAITGSIPTINVTALTGSIPTINVTALTDSIPTLNVTALLEKIRTGSTGSGQPSTATQEICFTSRSLDNNEQNESDLNAERWLPSVGTGAGTGTGSYSIAPGFMTGTDGTGSSTQSNTETSEPAGSVTCIVLEKPKRRRRRILRRF